MIRTNVKKQERRREREREEVRRNERHKNVHVILKKRVGGIGL